MIELSFSQAFLVPLAASLTGMVWLWIYYALRQTMRESRERGPTKIYRCRECHHVYIDHLDVPMALCPRCHTLNESIRR